MPRFEHFAHGADIGVRGYGATKEEAFANAALALTAVVTDPAGVRPLAEVAVGCSAPNDEILLVDWLNAVVYEMATRGMLFSEFRVSLDRGTLSGRAAGEAVDRARHAPAVEVKGATFTELRLAREPSGGWIAQCVVDV
jgi:tRNA nucleotidyltransferase (CCA-adding enzyme)